MVELSYHLTNCPSLVLRQEVDLLIQHGWHKCQTQCGFVDVCNWKFILK